MGSRIAGSILHDCRLLGFISESAGYAREVTCIHVGDMEGKDVGDPVWGDSDGCTVCGERDGEPGVYGDVVDHGVLIRED